MKKQLKKFALICVSALCVGTTGVAIAEPLESVIGLDVHNTGAFLSATDNYFETDDARDSKVTLWAVTFGGESDISHLAIADFGSYQEYEDITANQNSSPAWMAFVNSLPGLLDVKSRSMAVQRFRDGSGWQGHGAMAAFVMTISDPDAYTAAFREFVASSDNPGSTRLMELRFGGLGATHVVLISAPGSAALNEYLDELLSSDEYRVFAGKVNGIRTINNVEMLTRVRSYGN